MPPNSDFSMNSSDLRAARFDLASGSLLKEMTSMRLQDKVAVITGAAQGIGREAALLFAAEGARIVAVDVSDDAGHATVAELQAAGHAACYVHADVSQSADCQRMIATAENQFGQLNILFNNAGIMHADDGDAESTDEEIWELTMRVNLKGVYLGCKHGIPALRRAGGGSVINTASFVALLGAATPQLAYTASKGGVLAMTRELAIVHARESIRVNALCPGPLRTELLMKFLNTEEKRQRRLVHIPMGRFGEAKEMAQAALFLASDESSYLTGADFVVDGGITAAYVTPESNA
jgi:NAD(P)-dependent dehydrogenase (short-subunit alcohol dehydrogenase family)